MIEETDILTESPDLDLGKIEDAGDIVKGGRIDRYWTEEGLQLHPVKFIGTDKIIKSDWLHDPNKAIEHFNLRSIEFGNWMSQEDRANFLYGAMLSLHHLALIFQVKDEQIGFGGKLSIALGARGTGRAAGHYEPTPFSVINITKTNGIGVLAHEFAHALDNILSFHTKSKQMFVSGGRTTRKGYDETIAKKGNYFEKQFEDFFNILYYTVEGGKTGFHKALNEKDEYWNRRNEVFARTFEVYIADKQQKFKYPNHFLVSGAKGKAYPSLELVGQVSRIIGNTVVKGFQVMKPQLRKAASLRGIQGEPEVTGYDGFRKTLKKNANLDDTLANMKRIALRDVGQVRDLAEELQGVTVAETAENIWDFVRGNIAYKLDEEGVEELRTPARTWHDRFIGVDCDDYTILISALLLSLGIDHEYRVAAYKEKGKFQHIYPVAFDKFGNEYVIDNVPEIPQFNFEEQPIIDLKTVPMELHELSGLGEVTDENLADEAKTDLVDELTQPFTLSGVEDDDDDDSLLEERFLSGFGEVETEEDADIVLSGSEVSDFLTRGLLAEINKAKLTLMKEQKTPTVLSEVVGVPKELDIINDVMDAWEDEDERKEALQDAISQSGAYSNFYKGILLAIDKMEEQDEQGVSGFHDDDEIFLARINMNEFLEDDEDEDDLQGSDLGRRRKRKKGRLRNFFKKIGKGIKKIVKAVVRFNPATIALRGATLLVLKINVFKLASKLIYGYLTEEQAKAQGLDLAEWRKLVIAKDKAEKFFTKIGGKADKFRKAIVKGRARKKTGLNLSGLGVVATAAATTAASGFIVFVKKLLSKINPVKLFKKIGAKIKAKKQAKAAAKAGDDEGGAEAQIALDDFGADAGGDDFSAERFAQTNGDDAGTETETSENGGGGTPKKSIMQRLKGIWAKHKKKIVATGILGVVGLIAIVAWNRMQSKKKRSLSGIKAARTRAKNRRLQQQQIKGLLGKGSTTIVKMPSKKTSVTKLTNAERLKEMHRIAQELKKKHPNTKYSTLLSKAAKKIR